MEDKFTVDVRCLFCKSPLAAEEGKKYKSGDLIKCLSCKELNDYDSVIAVAKEDGINMVKQQLAEEVKKTMKKYLSS